MCSRGLYTLTCASTEFAFYRYRGRYYFVRIPVVDTLHYGKAPPATIRTGRAVVIRYQDASDTHQTPVEPNPPVVRPVTLNTDSFVVDWLPVWSNTISQRPWAIREPCVNT